MPKQLILKQSGYVMIPRKTVADKKIPVNMNAYRNLDRFVNNDAKKQSAINVKKYLEETGQDHIRFTKPVTITFKYVKPTRRRLDKSNVYAAAAKYFYDALVELGVLIDDNDDFIGVETILPTEYKKGISEITMVFTEIE